MEQKDTDIIFIESAMIRGIVINAITLLERMIDSFLSLHFTKDSKKASLLMSHVFATRFMTFENKRIIFNNILTEYYSDHKEVTVSGIHAKLDKFNKIRNEIAHYVIAVGENEIKHFKMVREVTYLKFEKSIENVTYSKEKAIEISNEIIAFVSPMEKVILSMGHAPPSQES